MKQCRYCEGSFMILINNCYNLCICKLMQLSGTVIKSNAILTGFIVFTSYLLMHCKL